MKNMKNNWCNLAFLASGLLFIQASASWAQPKEGDFISTVKIAPEASKVGQPVSITVVTTQKAALNGVVMVAVFDAKNKRIAAKDWQSAKLVKGKPGIYQWTWKPTAKGNYNVKSAIFGAKWKPTHYWDWRGTKLMVK